MDAKKNDAYLKLKEKLVSSGLLLNEEPGVSGTNGEPIPRRGVSLLWLKDFTAVLGTNLSTSAVVSRLVQPATRSSTVRGRRSLWELLPLIHTGPPNYMVVHAWGASFIHMVKQVMGKLDPPALPNMPPPPFVDLAHTYVWLDIVAIPQHPAANPPLIELPVVRETIAGCSGGTLVAVDSGLLVLSRLWCMFEIHLTVYPNNFVKLHILFPESLPLDFFFEYEHLACSLDISKTDASRTEDKTRLVGEIRHSVGTKRIHQELQAALVMQGRAALRWGTPMQHATYCALLANSSEWNTMHRTLMTKPELSVDKKTLEEIRNIFGMFDTDGSGELDEDEFVQVLQLAGFKTGEAKKMYLDVNKDGDEGVSLEEFEEWWVETQKQDPDSFQHIDVTAGAILENLAAFITLLDRQNLSMHANFFREKLREAKEDKKFLKQDVELAPSPLRTSSKADPDSIAWRLTNHDFREAAKLMYELFTMNASIIDANLSELPHPTEERDDQQLCDVTSQYLSVFVNLLQHYPSRQEQSANFALIHKELMAMLNTWIPGKTQLPKADLGGGKMPKTDKNWLEFDVVRSMIDLKYGQDHFVSKGLIQEAGIAISTWLSHSKLPATNKRALPGVDELSRSYMAGSSDPSGPPKGGLGQSDQKANDDAEAKPDIGGASKKINPSKKKAGARLGVPFAGRFGVLSAESNGVSPAGRIGSTAAAAAERVSSRAADDMPTTDRLHNLAMGERVHLPQGLRARLPTLPQKKVSESSSVAILKDPAKKLGGMRVAMRKPSETRSSLLPPI